MIEGVRAGQGNSRPEWKWESLRWRGLGRGKYTRRPGVSVVHAVSIRCERREGGDCRTQPAKHVTNVKPPATWRMLVEYMMPVL